MNKKGNEIKSGVTMGSDYWISFTDILTALLFIFILIICFFIFRYGNIISSLSKDEIDSAEKIARLNDDYKKLKKRFDELEVEQYNLTLKNTKLEKENKKLLEQNNELLKFKEDVEKYKYDWSEGYIADKEILKLLHKLHDELNDYNIKVQLDETNKTLNIDSSILGFKSGEYAIQPQYDRVVRVISNILHREINKDQVSRYIDAIFIEGYTDDEPYDKKEFFGNWGLSALRAISFWDSLNKSLKKQGQSDLSIIRSADGKKFLFSVSGYANVRPIICKDFEYESTCNKYQQECVFKYIDDPKKCFNESNIKFSDAFLEKYNTKNRRIGIRFIPYHKIDAKK